MAFSWTTAQAQEGFYFGPEGGWTGLQGTKSSITGTNPVTGQSVTVPLNQSFDSGWNVGARAGYQWGPWRFEGEYTHRETGGGFDRALWRLYWKNNNDPVIGNRVYYIYFRWPRTPPIRIGD